MQCPRCGQLHLIARFTIDGEGVTWATGYRPVISGFVCDGWFYRVEAFQMLHENVKVVPA